MSKKWTPKMLNKNNAEQVDHQKVKQKQCRRSGLPKSWKKTMSNKWVHILLYTFIYLHIPPYTFIYLQIALYNLYTFIYTTYIKILNIRKMRANIKHKNGHNLGPMGSPKARIWRVHYYHIVKCFFKAKGPQLLKFLGGHKVAKILYMGIPIVTMVNIAL